MSFNPRHTLNRQQSENVDTIAAMLDEYCYKYDDLMQETKAAWDSSSEAARTLYKDESGRWGPNKSIRCFNKIAAGVPAALAVVALCSLSPVIVPSYVIYKRALVEIERRKIKEQRLVREEMRDLFYTGRMMPPARVTRVKQDRSFTVIDFNQLRQSTVLLSTNAPIVDNHPPRPASHHLAHVDTSDFLDLTYTTSDDDDNSKGTKKTVLKPVLNGIHQSHDKQDPKPSTRHHKLFRHKHEIDSDGDDDVQTRKKRLSSRSYKHRTKHSTAFQLHKSPEIHALWRSNRRIHTFNDKDDDHYLEASFTIS